MVVCGGVWGCVEVGGGVRRCVEMCGGVEESEGKCRDKCGTCGRT